EEKDVAKKFREASEIYGNNQDALQLRAMNMVYEGIRHKSSLMILPSSALDSRNLGTTMGMAAMHQNNEILKESADQHGGNETGGVSS
ncbi:MAG: hypothetical protein PF479_18700, partial [Oceanispirochaeta sp.]|nr:hypothetical protein [Oceanispirochaeta sp.]